MCFVHIYSASSLYQMMTIEMLQLPLVSPRCLILLLSSSVCLSVLGRYDSVYLSHVKNRLIRAARPNPTKNAGAIKPNNELNEAKMVCKAAERGG